MIRISEAVEAIVESHSALRFGFYHGLLNLTKVARFLRPSIEARTKKEVTDAAVLMNLSRLQKKLARLPQSGRETLLLDKITIQSGLCAATVDKSPTSHRELNRVFTRIQSKSGFITVTEGMRQVTVIVEAENLRLLTTALSSPPRVLQKDLAAVGVAFDERYLKVKGILFQLMEEVALQDINVIEIASTATEFSIFLREEDVQLAFDAIFNRFSRRGARPPYSTEE
jgi:aspartokinase